MRCMADGCFRLSTPGLLGIRKARAGPRWDTDRELATLPNVNRAIRMARRWPDLPALEQTTWTSRLTLLFNPTV